MRRKEEKTSVSLEALLRLKRNERPSDDFWDSFDSDFQRRRLRALVEPQASAKPLSSLFLKAFTVAVPLLVVAGLLSVRFENLHQSSPPDIVAGSVESTEGSSPAHQNTEERAVLGEMLPDARIASSQFILDSIEPIPHHGNLTFRKVLYTPALHLSAPRGAFYVRDSFSSNEYKVTTADMTPARNF